VTAKAKVSAIAFESKDVTELGQRVARALLPPGQQVLPESLVVAPLGLANTDDDSITFGLYIAFQSIPEFNESQVKAAIAGQTPAEASQYLSTVLPLTQPPEITVWPSALPWLPRLTNRIDLKILGS
jgi:hypothetical protein